MRGALSLFLVSGTSHMCGHRFFIENRPRSRAGRTFRPKIDLAHERGALSGRKQTSLMSEVYCMDCFNIPHMSAVHFHTLQCPPHRCAGHCLRGDRLSHDDLQVLLFILIEGRLLLGDGLAGRRAGERHLYLAYHWEIVIIIPLRFNFNR